MSIDPRDGRLTWIEIDRSAVASNLGSFRRLLSPGVALQAVVKANGYGHGIETITRLAAVEGVASFGVHSVEEAVRVASLDLGIPILILGYVPTTDAASAVAAGAEVTVYNAETLEALSASATEVGKTVGCHLKVETGVGRQGIVAADLPSFLDHLCSLPGLRIAGVSTHFANIEDTTDHSFARLQLERFRELSEIVIDREPKAVRHCACSAAILTMPETRFDMVRVGIGLYGLWPSKETLLSCRLKGTEPVDLRAVLAWKTRIAQLKELPSDSFVGYGCTYRTSRPTRIAVLPIGYSDGYDRRLSGTGSVLIGGRCAPILGRVCMNIAMADVTDIQGCRLEDEVVLIGRQGKEVIGAETLASLCNTIPYEILARIAPQIPRIVVD